MILLFLGGGIVKKLTLTKTISNTNYTAFNINNELALSENSHIINININRSADYGYHFVCGWGIENNTNLFVYFDDAINATVKLNIYYVIIN